MILIVPSVSLQISKKGASRTNSKRPPAILYASLQSLNYPGGCTLVR
jgi:hypothetical protein